MNAYSSDIAWQKWSEIDPYFGVASVPEFRKERLADNIEEFFAGGERYVAERLESALNHFGFIPHGTAVDFGCGVGRLALPLAARFSQVVGIDIADGMLAEARRNAASHDVVNVVFRKSEDAAFAAVGHCNFVNSYIVLQHIPVKRGMAYIDRLLDVVAPGGVAALHFSVSRRMGFARNSLYVAKQYIPGVLPAVNLARGRRYDEPLMQMNNYRLPDVIALAENKGFGPALVSTEMHYGVLTASIMCQRVRKNAHTSANFNQQVRSSGGRNM